MTDFDIGEMGETSDMTNEATEGPFTSEALEAAEQADAQLEAQEEIADFITENWDDIADGEVSTEPLWEDYHDQFDKTDEVESSKALADLDSPYEPEGSPEPTEPEPPAEIDVPDEPLPGDLDWQPSDTGVKYPDIEKMEGNVGGPEKLG